ncbi:MAG: PRC-barrel domain-containing protein [Bacteroidota bacterium]
MGDVYQDNLVTLKELKKFKVAEGDVDIRGWRVTSSDGVNVGVVAELIVDREAMKVRYIDVHLNRDIFDREVDRHVLLPVGLARVAADQERVRLDNTTISDVLRLPPYAPGPISRDFERAVRESLGTTSAAPPSGDEARFYDHEHFRSEQLFSQEDASPESV